MPSEMLHAQIAACTLLLAVMSQQPEAGQRFVYRGSVRMMAAAAAAAAAALAAGHYMSVVYQYTRVGLELAGSTMLPPRVSGSSIGQEN